MDKGDYAKAAELYRQGIVETPNSLPFHYGLAIAATHLNLKDEAIREFKWVLARAPKGSTESEAAQRWLASVGALPSAEAKETATDEDARPAAGQASLEGAMVMLDAAQNPPQRRMVILYGIADTPTKEERRQVRTDEKGRFRFSNLPPGSYMITDAVSGARNWRLRVQLQPGQAATLDLTPSNHIRVKDDFPNQG